MQGISRIVPRWLAVLMVAAWGLILANMIAAPSSGPQPASDQQVSQANVNNNPALFDVLWIDRYPEVQHDTWKAYLYTSDNVGISVDAQSAFKLTIEVFEFKADAARLTFHFPHDGRKAGCAYTIEKLKKPTKHFDIQLTVQNDPQNAGVTKSYFSGPEFRSASSLPSWMRESLEASGAAKYLDTLGKNAE